MDAGESEPVTATLLRSMPVNGWMIEARRERAVSGGLELLEAIDAGLEHDLSPSLVDELRGAAAPWLKRPTGRPKTLDVDHYRLVADLYSASLAAGGKPLDAVAKHWTISRPTASRWVRAARDAALLPPTARGVARGNMEAVTAPSDE